ncbi:MAG: hydrogenase expression/formation protein HypE [Saprospiraceae bacterium]|nr:hydrogenase expression/formation protein HypE [Saprospiraceae bacterium]
MQLECPLPEVDFEMITLGHGSGGLLTNRLLDSGVFDLLNNEYLDKRHDGSVLNLSGPVAFTTDSFVISPIFFPGGDIGELSVNGTVNDLVMCGARPEFISLSFIIEEGLLFSDFWRILISIKYACQVAGIKVVTGDTKVVERGKGDKIFINTTGIGTLHQHARIDIKNIVEGDKIIVSDQIATHGISIMSVREGLEFETTIESDTRSLHMPVLSMLDHFGDSIHLLRDPTRGGVATVLNEIARDTALGVEIQESCIPVDDQVNAACEMLGLDPLYVANEGVFVAVVNPSAADEVLNHLRRDPACREASVIGEITKAHPRQVVINSRIGGKRVVNMLVGEQLPRIC